MIRLTNRVIIPVVTLVSAVLWLVAAFVPAYFSSGESDVYGLMCFAYGPFALLFMPSMGMGWLGNIFWGVAVWGLWKRDYKYGLWYAGLAVGMGSVALFITEIPADENGGMDSVTLGPGIFLWLGSLVTILLGMFVTMRNKNTPEPELRFTKWQKGLDPKTRVRLTSLGIGVAALLAAAIYITITEIHD